jgi:acetyl esterase/lipase
MASEALSMIVQMLRAQRPLELPSVEQMRAGLEAMAQMAPLPPDVRLQAVDAGGVPGEWVEVADSERDRTVLYLHGGGYVIGSTRSHRDLVQRIARAARARVLSIDYRLAPEHPHPAAVEDALAAYRWLLASGVAASRVAIAGDSAGGGLTAATLVALRDAGDPLPAAAVLLSPWVDLEGLGESMRSKAEIDPMVQREALLRMAELYLGGQDPRTPLAAPLHADLHGLPPLLIQVGTAETLLDDSLRFAEKARAQGVEVILEPWEDMIHVWQAFAALLPEGQQAIERIGAFLRERIPSEPARNTPRP